MSKKTEWKSQKTEWKPLDTRQRASCNSYSILFNLCSGPVFITSIRIKEIECAFSYRRFWLKKWTFDRCVRQNWEEIESLKIKKSWNSVFLFPYEPCLNTMFCLLLVSCLVVELFIPIHTTVMLTVCYINRQPGRGYHYFDTNACGESAERKKREHAMVLVFLLKWVHLFRCLKTECDCESQQSLYSPVLSLSLYFKFVRVRVIQSKVREQVPLPLRHEGPT